MIEKSMVPRCISFSGMDGAGKSTHASSLADALRQHGMPVSFSRIRFPFLLSLPLLVYARLRRFSRTVEVGSQRAGVHEFEKSRLLQRVYPYTLWIDLALGMLMRVRVPIAVGRFVVCDRFVLDTLVDLATSCSNPHILSSSIGSRFLTLIPKGTMQIMLVVGRDELLGRRQETAIDPKASLRMELYTQLASYPGLVLIPADRAMEEVERTVMGAVESAWSEANLEGRTSRGLSGFWYSSVADSRLPRGVRATILLAGHWLLQSIPYMDRTERALKLLLDVLLFIGFFLLTVGWLGPSLASMVSFVAAHSINFIANAHIPVVLKHVGLKVGEDRVAEYAGALKARSEGKSFLEGGVVLGSMARGELRATSDLDVRIIKCEGPNNAIRAFFFMLAERTRALLVMFPLDVYLLDDPRSLGRLRESKRLIILFDRYGRISDVLRRTSDSSGGRVPGSDNDTS